MGGWNILEQNKSLVDEWKGGWEGVKAGLRIAYGNQKLWLKFTKPVLNHSCFIEDQVSASKVILARSKLTFKVRNMLHAKGLTLLFPLTEKITILEEPRKAYFSWKICDKHL